MHNIIIQNNKASVVSFHGLWKGTQSLQSDVCTMNKLFHTINIFAQRCHIDKKSRTIPKKSAFFKKPFWLILGLLKHVLHFVLPVIVIVIVIAIALHGTILEKVDWYDQLFWNETKCKICFTHQSGHPSRLRHDNVRMSFGRNVSIKFFCGHICPFFKCSLKNIDKNNKK